MLSLVMASLFGAARRGPPACDQPFRPSGRGSLDTYQFRSKGDRGFESFSLEQRVVQTIGSSAVELTSLILGRSVRVTSATHGEAELEDTVRALRNPGSAAGRLLAAGEGGRLITTSGPKSAVVLESCLADNIASPANDIERGGLLRIANPNRRGRWQPCGKTALVSFGRSRR